MPPSSGNAADMSALVDAMTLSVPGPGGQGLVAHRPGSMSVSFANKSYFCHSLTHALVSAVKSAHALALCNPSDVLLITLAV
ncbi:unnamed protein product [Dibothriocephalus latus]|uniref:Uncharacterized protein n=1 Tax=Dibothriocephalus latus TaxID=60516 RepID=A0A3P7P5F1_DIBLA|nr:unnamed protein product [Dibothriocephalus latus]